MRKWNIKIASVIVVLVLATVATMGQNRNPVLRMVRGTVMDKQGRALASSVVYLHDQKTRAVKTQIADNEGRYRFSGMSPYVDYEIHAEHREGVSSVHRLSALHSKREVVRDLGPQD